MDRSLPEMPPSPLLDVEVDGLLVALEDVLDGCRDLLAAHRPVPGDKRTAFGREAVTDVDVAIEEALRRVFASHLPRAAFLGEETAPGGPPPAAAPVCVVVDPLDGTREYLAGSSNFGCSIGLFVAGAPVLGMVDLLERGHRLAALATSGGWELRGDARVLAAPPADRSRWRLGVSPPQLAWFSPQARRMLRLVPVGSTVAKIAGILLGGLDGVVVLPSRAALRIWDYAGGAIVLAAAGGRLTDPHGDELLRTLPLDHPGGWLAGSPGVVAALQALWPMLSSNHR